MSFFKKIILLLHLIIVFGWCIVLNGCAGKGSISLEEALLANENDTDISLTEGNHISTYAGGEGTKEQNKDADSDSAGQLLYVYVCGSVEKPGVYALEEGSRIVAAIEAAGGFSDDAATESVNLAAPVADGMQIVVPDMEEAASSQTYNEKKREGLINLNTASVKELCTLQGIGEAKAEAIVAYREEIGAFTSLEQIKKVTGIGENLFKQIKESIYIE